MNTLTILDVRRVDRLLLVVLLSIKIVMKILMLLDALKVEVKKVRDLLQVEKVVHLQILLIIVQIIQMIHIASLEAKVVDTKVVEDKLMKIVQIILMPLGVLKDETKCLLVTTMGV